MSETQQRGGTPIEFWFDFASETTPVRPPLWQSTSSSATSETASCEGLQNKVVEFQRLNVRKLPAGKNLRFCPVSSRACFLLGIRVEASKPQARMKRIEAVIKRSALDDFHRCAKQLGIFGFDLSEDRTRRRDHQPLAAAGEYAPDGTSRVKVDFAVLDEETKPTVHAVLESVHPESIAIFKFDQDTQPQRRSGAIHSKV